MSVLEYANLGVTYSKLAHTHPEHSLGRSANLNEASRYFERAAKAAAKEAKK